MIRTLDILSLVLAAPEGPQARVAGRLADALFDDGALSPEGLAEVDRALGALARGRAGGRAGGRAEAAETAHLSLFLDALAAGPAVTARRRLGAALLPLEALRLRLERARSPLAGVLAALVEIAAAGAATGGIATATGRAAISPVGSAGAEWHNDPDATAERGAP